MRYGADQRACQGKSEVATTRILSPLYSEETSLQRRVSPMGTFASGWRLIGATVAHLRLKRSEWTLLVFEKTSPCYPNLDSRYRETGQHLFTGCISLIFRRSGSQ